jgi:type VII secretion-associated serine protease mycosin
VVRRGIVWLLTLTLLASGQVPGGATPTRAPSPASGDAAPIAPRVERSVVEHAAGTEGTVGLLVRADRGVGASRLGSAVRGAGLELGELVAGTDWWQVEVDDADQLDTDELDAVRDALERTSAIVEVVEDRPRRAFRLPNDPLLHRGDQPYLHTIRAPLAWDLTTGASNVVVAVLDTGVRANHPDLQGKVLRGRSFVPGVSSTDDDNGHGTAVAGLIAARTDDGQGMAGVGWNTRVLPVKVLDREGVGTDGSVAAGIVWAADQGAQVINLSLGGPDASPVLADAVRYARERGSVVVAAAGNEGSGVRQYPAAIPDVVAVGATDAAGRLADFSNHGEWIDLVAPGFDVVTTVTEAFFDQPYAALDGTSFAAPLVAGGAALVRARYPAWTPSQVEARLRTTARDAGPRGIDPYYGRGMLDVAAAVGQPLGSALPIEERDALDPNDLPDRATPVAAGQGLTATIAPEGDVDWYRLEVSGPTELRVRIEPPRFDWNDARSLDPVLELYDDGLRLIAFADDHGVGRSESLEQQVAAGSYLVRVSNDGPSSGNGAYTLHVQAPDPTPTEGRFDPFELLPVGAEAVGTAAGDVDGDGVMDLLATTTAHQLALLRGAPDGSFERTAPVASGGTGFWQGTVEVLQLTDSGPPHVLVGSHTGLRSFRWDGERLAFQEVIEPGNVLRVALGDLDGDGVVDVVAGVHNVGIVALRRAGQGWERTVVAAGNTLEDLAVGDLDGDGRAEIATPFGARVHLDRQTDEGWRRELLEPRPVTDRLETVNGLAIGDTDGDGRADLVVAVGGNRPRSAVQRFRSRPDGSLGTAEVVATVDIPQPVEIADVTGDGIGDVVVAHGGWRRLSVLAGTEGGALSAPELTLLPYTSHYRRGGLTLADLDGDGDVDVAVSTGSNVVTLRNRTATAAPPAPEPDTSPADVWVRDTAPVPHAQGVDRGAPVTVRLTRPVTTTAAQRSGVVRLLDARTGKRVTAAVTVEGGDRLVVRPGAALVAGTPYALWVDGLEDTSGARQDEALYLPFVAARDATAPPAVTEVAGSAPAVGQLRLTWTRPSVADLDVIEVRMTDTTTWPTATTGTLVYRGTGTSLTLTGLDPKRVRSLGVWAVDRSGNRSARVTARLDGTLLTGARSRSKLVHGEAVDVTAAVTSVATGKVVAGRTVELLERPAGTTAWKRVASAATAKDGTIVFTRKPTRTTAYRVRAVGTPTAMAAEVSAGTVSVAPRVTLQLSRTSVARNDSVAATGKVLPTMLAGETVELQRLRDGTWSTVQRTTVRTDGTYRFGSVPTSSRGTFSYRVRVPATTTHLVGTSPRITLTVS